MSRVSAFGKIRRYTGLHLQNQKSSFSDICNIKSHCTVGIPCSLWRLYLGYKLSFQPYSSFALYKAKGNLYKSSGCRSFYAYSLSIAHQNHAQVTWKRLYQMFSYSGPVLSPISLVARAVSLALTRSNLLAPGIIAFLVGDFAWRKQALAEAVPISTKDTLYMNVQDGHVYLSSLIVSLLQGFILILRAIYIAVLFTPCVIMAPLADSFGVEFRKTWVRLVHLTLEKAGPAFIKWGQWAATRPDLFAKDLCTELAELHTQAPAHSFFYTKRAIERAFGRKLTEIFDKFEEKPLASGSVAQVHRAILKYGYPSQKIKPIAVAVKVRHPGVAEAIRRDFVIINFVAKISSFIPTLKWLRLDESVQQFAVFMISQVDLAREAAHLSRFSYNFRRWKDVSFPKPLYPLVHPAVLVETYEQGDSVLHYVNQLQGDEHIKSALAHLGSHALLKMLLVDNFIHADMHPGNILVRVKNSNAPHKGLFTSRPHVIFLDVGMTAELSKRDRINLLEFFKAVARRDGRAAAEFTLRLSKRQNCPHPKAFIEEVEKTFKFWDSPEGDSIHGGDCMRQLLEQVRHHRVNIDGDVCTVMVTTLVLEGWQQKLDPDYNVMDTLQTLLFKADWAETLVYTIEGLMAP